MKMHTIQRFALGALLAGGLAFASTAQASVLVYEGFQYSNVGDPLDAITTVDTDAIGLTGSWTDAASNTEMFLKSGSLNFSDLSTNGNHIGYLSNSNNDIFNRQLTSGVGGAQEAIDDLGVANGTLYFSFLFEKLQNNFGADHEGFALMNGVLPQSRWDSGNAGAVGRHGFAVAAVNNSNLNAVAYDGTTGTRVVSSNTLPITVVNGGSNTSTSNVEVNLVLGEISFNTGTGGADVFSLYSVADDGALDASDLTLIDTIEANVDESTLSTLNLTRQVNVNYDEVRIATTLDEALGLDGGTTPIPSPSAAVMGIVGLALVGSRRRR